MHKYKMKQHYIYETIFPDGTKYIGYHYGKLKDNYFGSGVKLKEKLKYFSQDVIQKKIISVHETQAEARIAEREQTILVDAVNDSLYLNMIPGGNGCIAAGKTYEEIYGIEKAKLLKIIRSKSSKGRKWTKKQRALLLVAFKKRIPWNKEMVFDKNDLRCRGGRKNKGKKSWNSGITGKKYTKHYSSGLTPPSMLGRIWINNGIEQKKILKEQNIPQGWKKGRLKFSGNDNPMRKIKKELQ